MSNSKSKTGISYTGRNWGPGELGISLSPNTWLTVDSLTVTTAVNGYVSCIAVGSFDYDVNGSTGYGRVGWTKSSSGDPTPSEVIGGNASSNNTNTYDAFTTHFVSPHLAGTQTYYIRASQTFGSSGDMDIVISQASCMFIENSVAPKSSKEQIKSSSDIVSP